MEDMHGIGASCRMTPGKVCVFIFIMLLLLLLPSCGRNMGENVIHVAYSQDIPTLDVMKSNNRALRDMLVGHVYERLFVIDENGEIQNELATGYELTSGNHALEVGLRKDVPFHDGSRMTSRDAAASLNRWISSCRDAERMTGDNRFTIVSDDRIRIESSESLLFFPYLLAASPFSAVIMPERIAAFEPGFLNDVVGTGPYKVGLYLSGDRLELEKFPDYQPNVNDLEGIAGTKHGYARGIIYHIVPDAITRRIGLERGEYDHINDVMSQDIPLFEENDSIRLYGGEESGCIALVFNRRSTDAELRKIIDIAIDSESLMKSCYGDYGYSLHGDYMEKGSPFSLMTPSSVADLDSAGKLVEERGLSGRRIGIITSNLSNLDKIGVELSSELERIGLQPELTVYDWAGFIDRRREGGVDIMISAFSSVPLPTMKVFLSPVLLSSR